MKNIEMTLDTGILYKHRDIFPADIEILPLRSYVAGKKRYFFAKRCVDLFVSVLLILLVFSWLFPIIALLIVLDSRGPVFFFQRRVGKGGRTFICYKFRTMVVNFDADHKQATENDARITRFGNFLRKSNLDELPQLFNVLMGDMSIVGPRPHMLSDCVKFSSVVSGYKLRNLVKPGITGLAQVNGFHGPTSDNHSILKRFENDINYIYTAGLWLDLKITIATVFKRLNFILSSR